MARKVNLDEITTKLEGFTLHGSEANLFLECLDCGGILSVVCPDSEKDDPHVGLNGLMMAAINHECEIPDLQCAGCCAVAEEQEDELSEEVETGILAIEAFLDQQEEQ